MIEVSQQRQDEMPKPNKDWLFVILAEERSI
jgi:hypothetical protein